MYLLHNCKMSQKIVQHFHLASHYTQQIGNSKEVEVFQPAGFVAQDFGNGKLYISLAEWV